MRNHLIIVVAVLCALIACSDEPSGPEETTGAEETISSPTTPTGVDTTIVDEPVILKTGGAASNVGHTVHYRFDLNADGDHDYTEWSAVDSVVTAWPDSGLYSTKAQARCALHDDIVSEWSDGKNVTIREPGEVISIPGAATGSPEAQSGRPETYCTSGAASNLSHLLEYQLDFDAGGTGALSDWGTLLCVAHTWSTAGPYTVKSRARCAEHTDVVTAWSSGKYVGVDYEVITSPSMPVGPHTWVDVVETFRTSGSASTEGHPIEYRFDFDADGAGDTTEWSTSNNTTHAWTEAGTYVVKAQARCQLHPAWTSNWSVGRSVVVSVVTELPEIRFATHIDGVSRPYTHAVVPNDTVGVMQPFAISYHGLTVNGEITHYQYFPLTSGVVIEGSNVWYDDLVDTSRTFTNTGPELIPSGVFRFAAQCRDRANAESVVDAGTFAEGVCQVVVNFDPDTRISNVHNSYTVNSIVYERVVDFADGMPDTVPYGSWVQLRYYGWDDARDGRIECNDFEPDKCIGFQLAYRIETVTMPGWSEFSNWLPRDGVHDTDPFSSTDSSSINIGSLEYDLFARAVDEHGRPDGAPPSVEIIGNFDPTLDSVAVEDHLGNRIDLSVVDTLTWNFWKGEGWPYTSQQDTLDLGGPEYFKIFSFNVKGWGHDHPWEPNGSGVKAWQYHATNSSGQSVNIGRANAGFFDGAAVDILDDKISVEFRYPVTDPTGDTVFDNLPSWFDDDLTFVLTGRDTEVNEPQFSQYMFIDGQQTLLNVFSASRLGRRTQERTFAFQVRLVR